MYGYVRPAKPELKIKEFERYRAAYCGLCHALKQRFGFRARFCVNYDMTLPILLAVDTPPILCHKRCAAHPLKKRCIICTSPMLDRAADMTMVLAYHKMSDSVADSKGIKRLIARWGRFLLRRGYRKAAARETEFDALTRTHLDALAALEQASTHDGAVLDQTAAEFGAITAAFSLLKPEHSRIWHELFYHIGRYVYILDAADDAAEDFTAKRFNPLHVRYQMTAPELSAEQKEELAQTLELSLSLAASAFELLPPSEHTPIAANLLYLGLPATIRTVFAGKPRKKRRWFGKSEL
ncbi:MAG: hypothetical protein IKU55_02505 [Clostridia bacterium]|nr:hypothetical protein [Clostridia bacterium]